MLGSNDKMPVAAIAARAAFRSSESNRPIVEASPVSI
jgi:hypothetical protein